MNRVVYKYVMPNPGAGRTNVAMPEGADIVHVDIQNGKVCAWAVVDPQAPLVDRVFYTVATGQIWKEDGHGKPMAHLGTMLTLGGGLVWHLFVETD